MPKRGNNIYKRKDGRWEARYVKEIGANGKKFYSSVYGATYKEARNKQLVYINRSQSAADSNAKTLSEIMNEWLFSIENSVKKSTFQKYQSIIKNHIDTHMIGSLSAHLLTVKTYSDYSKDKMNSKQLSPKTVNDILTVISLALSYAEEVYGVKKPKLKRVKEPVKEMRVLSVIEQKRLENYLYDKIDSYKFGILLALYTGIRIGELCALQWDDVRDDCIIISKTMHRINVGNHTILEVTEPKTISSNRVIPIPLFFQKNIIEFRKPTGSVLLNRNGKPVEPRLMQMKFEKSIESCGLPRTNFHALRHTFATRCIEAGFDIKSLSEILGHADVKTTLNKYVHSSYELKQRNMELLKPAKYL